MTGEARSPHISSPYFLLPHTHLNDISSAPSGKLGKTSFQAPVFPALIFKVIKATDYVMFHFIGRVVLSLPSLISSRPPRAQGEMVPIHHCPLSWLCRKDAFESRSWKLPEDGEQGVSSWTLWPASRK